MGFDVLAPPGGHAELVLVSAWRSDRDMRAHFRSEAYGRYVSAVTDLLTRPSDVTIYGISGTVRPPRTSRRNRNARVDARLRCP